MPNDGDLVDLIPLMMPEASMQRRVLIDNPQRLYEFTA
jgi:predicted TIM-barrel fold metal-dependent hydrolase